MTKGRTLIRPEWTTLPPGDITPVEWNDTKSDVAVAFSEAQLSQTRTFDTRAYPSIQDAIDTAHVSGGGTVFLGNSELTPQTLTLYDGVYLTGRGAGATKLSVSSIAGTGSVDALPALGANVSRNARTVTFSGSHGLVPGDVFVIYNPNDRSFSPARAYYRDGEFCKVAIVDGNDVTLSAPTFSSHNAGVVEVYKMNPIRTGVSGMTIECSPNITGIKIDFGTDLIFRDLVMYGSQVSMLTVSRCFGVNINDVKAYDYGPLGGTNYGLTISNSQRIRINHVELETRRHGLSTGGDSQPICIPNRDIIVADSYINGLSELGGVTGCNMHGNSEHVRFDNCTMPSGCNPAGDYVTYRGCQIDMAPWGSAVSCMEMLGCNLTFENCRFRANGTIFADRGLIYLFFGTMFTRGSGVLRFVDNVVDLDTYTTPGGNLHAIYLLTSGADSMSGTRNVEIKNNRFRSLAASTTYARSLWVRTVSGNANWTTINYEDNLENSGMEIYTDQSPQTIYYVGEGGSIPSFQAARGSMYRRRGPTATAPVMYVNQSGTTTWKQIDTL